METLDDLIRYGTDSRETKRALSVKMVQNGMAPKEISHLLNVSQQYVSKWKGIYERQGVEGLRLEYQGKEALLKPQQRAVVVQWIKEHETLRVEEVRDYVESHYGVLYGSKQSYYDLLSEGGMSYHHSEGVNPKGDEGQVLQKREEIKKLARHHSEIERGEIVVLLEDECHLQWGNVCGLVWGNRNKPIEVSISNQHLRQTYYGAINLYTHEFHLNEYDTGNGVNTVAYLKWLQRLYPGAKLWLIWDGASYHRFAKMRDYLAELNAGLPEEQWQVSCTLFAPNAPEQNPVEDIWLKGKNWLRKRFALNKTFAQVKQCFVDYLKDRLFHSAKFDWYMCRPQII